MTIRSIAGLFIKLLGVHYVASAVWGIASAIGLLLSPQPQGILHPVQYALGPTVGGWLGGTAVGVVLMFGGDAVARRLFDDRPLPIPNLLGKDVLRIGVCLLGIGMGLVGAVPAMRAIGTVVWYLGGERQAEFGDAIRRLWPSLLDGLLSLIGGLLLVRIAGPLSSFLESRSGNRRET
jgi:hypothetical protein